MVSLTWQLAKAAFLAVVLFNTEVNSENITSDTFFYGQVPAVNPTRDLPLPLLHIFLTTAAQMPATSPWSVAHAKALKLVSAMSLEEQANITVGYTPENGCSGVTGSVPRLNWPGLCLADAGQGVRGTDLVNAYPAGLHVGASWNRALTISRAAHMAREFRAKGVHVLLGPVVGPLGRIALGGRNWEGFSNDPYLCGLLAADTVRGIQDQGVIASVKHFVGNEQEYHRNPITYGNTTSNITVEAVSTNIDDKTMHELYLWPFVDTVQAGAGSVMCSYQRINNSYACHNSKSQNGLLKGELGFEGFIVSDWRAQHAGVASAEGGLDMAMPNSSFWGTKGEKLALSAKNGSLSESRITDMATRILAAWYQTGQDEGFPEIGIWPAASYTGSHKKVNARDPTSKPTLLQGAIEGHVLVKNVKKTLPLKSPQMISVFGYDAPTPPQSNLAGKGGYRLGFLSLYGYDYLLTIRKFLSPGSTGPNGTMIVGGGSGGTSPPYISSPWDALQEQAYEDDTTLFWDFVSSEPEVDSSSDACLVFINAFATEAVDRDDLHDDFSDALVLNVAKKCPNTVVVIHNAGPRLVDQWIEHENITAVIFGHLPGQDSGRALVSLLYGKQSPSGKLPYTVARNESQYNAIPAHPVGEYGLFPQDTFTEGVYIDYRDFDKKNMTPRYEFGFGLTYTTFSFSSLTTELVPGISTAFQAPASPVIEGGIASLFDIIARVTAVVTNTGDMEAMEVAQLYVGIPNGPIRQLRGFEKVNIAPGKNASVSFDLTRRDLSEWNVVEQAWTLQQEKYAIWVGSSSRNLPLSGSLDLE